MDVQMRPRCRSFGRIETALHRERRQHRYQFQEGRCRPPMHTVQNPHPTIAQTQVRLILHPPPASYLIGVWSGLTGTFFAITAHPVQDRPRGIKGHVSKVQGRAVKVTPHSQFTAKIKSVVTVGKEELNGAEASRANLILDAFKGQIPSSPARSYGRFSFRDTLSIR
jgi:hypothetical protein